MPQTNPGFDLSAMKDNIELRVEVKGHRRMGWSVDVTHRELVEYYRARETHSFQWQLWNVQNVSRNAGSPIRITRYVEIPEEALRSRTHTVDLRKCQSVQDEHRHIASADDFAV